MTALDWVLLLPGVVASFLLLALFGWYWLTDID